MIEKRVSLLEMFEHPEFMANFEATKKCGCPYSIRSKSEEWGQITLIDLDNNRPYTIQLVECEQVGHNGKLLTFWEIDTPHYLFVIFNYGEIQITDKTLK